MSFIPSCPSFFMAALIEPAIQSMRVGHRAPLPYMLWFSAPPLKMSGLSKPGLYQTGAMLYAIDVMNDDKPPSNHRFTVKEAAKRLNVSEASIRQRIQRGSIAHEKDEETNRVYVLISEDFDRLDEDETR